MGALFGQTREAVLRLLFQAPEKRMHLRQVLRAANAGSGAVQRELSRLVDAGLIVRSVDASLVYYQANRACPIFEEIRSIVRKTFGVADILRDAMEVIRDKILLAFVFGSIAAGNDTAASDIDLLVVMDRGGLNDVVAATSGAERELAREVNPTVYRKEEFCRKLAEGHHFLSAVVAAPKIFLVGDERELAGLAPARVVAGAQNKPSGDRGSSRSR